ncbi:hypothetical protein EC991_004494 [Linnemannia zychae]|nr:hypothetical protein EC991_004494 [Linnemannia zychae]
MSSRAHFSRTKSGTEPWFQGLRAANDPKGCQIVRLHNQVPYYGDKAFTRADVERIFHGHQSIRRETRDEELEYILPTERMINIDHRFQQVMAYPAYPGEILCVRQPDVEYQAPRHEQFQHPNFDMGSNEDSQGPHGNYSLENSSSSSGPSLFTPGHSRGSTSSKAVLHDAMDLFAFPYKVINLKAYSICKNPRLGTETTPHFSGLPGVNIKKPAELIKKNARPLLLGAMDFLRFLQRLKGGSQKDLEEYLRTIMLLKADLDLLHAHEVEPLVVKMISHLRELLPQGDALTQEHTVEPPPMSIEEVTSLSLLLGPKAEITQHGLIRARDSQGRENRVCPTCYHRLYPSYDADYVTNYIGADGWYDSQEGQMGLRPESSENLLRLCLLDIEKVGFVTEIFFDLTWDLTAEEQQLVSDFSNRLDLTILTISSLVAIPPRNVPDLLPPLPIESPGAQLSRLAKAMMTDKLTHLSVVSDSTLDARAVLLELQTLPQLNKVQAVTVSTPSSRYQAALCDGKIHLIERESDLTDTSALSTTNLDGTLLSLTMNNVDRFSSDEEKHSLRGDIKTLIRINPRLTTLSLHCPADKFREVQAMMWIILSELVFEQSPARHLATLTLVDNSDDRVSATFNLPFNQDPRSIVTNITAGNPGPGLNTMLYYFASSVQVLHISNKFGPADFQVLYDSFSRESECQLTVVTIVLSDLDVKCAEILLAILQLARATLRQVTLVGAPSDNQVSQMVITALSSLDLRRVILFADGSDMKQWICKAQESLPAQALIFALDHIEEFCTVMPGYDVASLQQIMTRQDNRTEVPENGGDDTLSNRFQASICLDDEPNVDLVSSFEVISSFSKSNQRNNPSDLVNLRSYYKQDSLPRFVALPKKPTSKPKTPHRMLQGSRRNPTSLSDMKFRLFFLCDDIVNNTELIHGSYKHSIHPIGHKGYNIVRQNEFFKKYGSFILTALHMTKHRTSSPGAGGPDLQRRKSFDWPARVDSGIADDLPAEMLELSDRLYLTECYDEPFDDLDAKVDSSIAYLESILEPRALLASSDTKTLEEQPRALSPEDLLQLQSFLKTSDQEQTLGNLYRTMTPDGNVKWVCPDHYHTSLAAKAVPHLQAAIHDLGGVFNEFTGFLRIKMPSQSAATRFYSILESSPPVQELDLSFEWSPSNQDLHDLCNALRSTKAFYVRLDGGNHPPLTSHLSDPPYYDSLLQIMSTESLQTIELTGWNGLLTDIETVPQTLNMRRLKIQLQEDEEEKGLNGLASILRASPRLQVLSLDIGKSEHVVEPVVETLKDGGWPHDFTLVTESQYSRTNILFVGGLDPIKIPSCDLRVLNTAKTRLFDIPSLRSIHVQRAQDLSTLLTQLDKCIKTNSGLDSVLIETQSNDLVGWLKEFQDLFAKYPHQRPRFCITDGDSTLTTNDIQDHDSTESTSNLFDTPLFCNDDEDDDDDVDEDSDYVDEQDDEGRELVPSPLISLFDPI